jgi:hypothetical protein
VGTAGLIAARLVPTIGKAGLKDATGCWTRRVNGTFGVAADATLQTYAVRAMFELCPLHTAVRVVELGEHSVRHHMLTLAGVGFAPIKLDAKKRATGPTIDARIGPHALISAQVRAPDKARS